MAKRPARRSPQPKDEDGLSDSDFDLDVGEPETTRGSPPRVADPPKQPRRVVSRQRQTRRPPSTEEESGPGDSDPDLEVQADYTVGTSSSHNSAQSRRGPALRGRKQAEPSSRVHTLRARGRTSYRIAVSVRSDSDSTSSGDESAYELTPSASPPRRRPPVRTVEVSQSSSSTVRETSAGPSTRRAVRRESTASLGGEPPEQDYYDSGHASQSGEDIDSAASSAPIVNRRKRRRIVSSVPSKSRTRDSDSPSRFTHDGTRNGEESGQYQLSNQTLTKIFTEAQAEHQETGVPYTEITNALVEEHGIYTFKEWNALFQQFLLKTGGFQSSRLESAKRYDLILREAHLRAWTGNDGVKDVEEYLTATFPELNNISWKSIYTSWRYKTDRFSTLPELDIEGYEDLFSDYIGQVEDGVSLADIGELVAHNYDEPEQSAEEWAELFGTWLRTQVPPQRSPPGLTISKAQRSLIACHELAKLFKASFDSPKCSGLQVGRLLTRKSGYSAVYVGQLYGEWRSRRLRYEDSKLDVKLQYTGQGRQGDRCASSAPDDEADEPKVSIREKAEKGALVPRASFRTLPLAEEDRIALLKLKSEADPDAIRAVMTPQLWARVFKNNYDSRSYLMQAVGLTLAPYTSYAPLSIREYYADWRQGRGYYADLDDDLAFEDAGPEAPPASTPPPPEPIRNPTSNVNTHPPREIKKPWTKEDYEAMAAYIYLRLPLRTLGIEADWQDFAASNPERSAHKWAQRFEKHGPDIRYLVPKLRDADLGHHTEDPGYGGPLPATRKRKRKRVKESDVDSEVEEASLPLRKKRWTQEDYEAMATYISLRLPLRTCASEEDWEDFAASNPERSAHQWAHRFSSCGPDIRWLVPELRDAELPHYTKDPGYNRALPGTRKRPRRKVQESEEDPDNEVGEATLYVRMRPWTQEDLEAMAAYVSLRLPLRTRAAEEDWEDFAASHPERPARIWAYRFNHDGPKIRLLVPELRDFRQDPGYQGPRSRKEAERKRMRDSEAVEAEDEQESDRGEAEQHLQRSTEDSAGRREEAGKRRRMGSGPSERIATPARAGPSWTDAPRSGDDDVGSVGVEHGQLRSRQPEEMPSGDQAKPLAQRGGIFGLYRRFRDTLL